MHPQDGAAGSSPQSGKRRDDELDDMVGAKRRRTSSEGLHAPPGDLNSQNQVNRPLSPITSPSPTKAFEIVLDHINRVSGEHGIDGDQDGLHEGELEGEEDGEAEDDHEEGEVDEHAEADEAEEGQVGISNAPPRRSAAWKAGFVERMLRFVAAVQRDRPEVVENPEFREMLLYMGQGAITDDDIPRLADNSSISRR